MCFKQLPIVLIFLFCYAKGIAQQTYYNKTPAFLKANSVWAFGLGAGLDFSSGGPSPISTSQFSYEGCASVADPETGKLLFYSNGGNVWNANHQIMPNGTGLLGNSNLDAYSTMQGVCIVPAINNPGKYYIFSLAGRTGSFLDSNGTLFYNIVDMKLNNGLGDVVVGQKNICLTSDTMSEGMIAIPGDTCDVWLLLHHDTRDEFWAFHITQQGIDTIPVISGTLPPNSYSYPGSYLYGAMAVSPDRTKIVLAPGMTILLPLVLGQFDAATGKVDSAIIPIDYPFRPNLFSAAFSPDNTKLYIIDDYVGRIAGLASIQQFDLSTYDSAFIVKSQKQVASVALNDYSNGELIVPHLKLYNDTIYLGDVNAIHRINKPNLLGTACDFQLNAIQLVNGDSCTGPLGSEVVFVTAPMPLAFGQKKLSLCVNEESFALRAPEGYQSYIWDDGSTAAERIIQDLGTYWVRSMDFCRPRVDTFLVQSLFFPKPIIRVDVTTLSTYSYESYQWLLNGMVLPGSIDSSHIALNNGDYQVIVRSGNCIDTSEIYRVTNAGNGNAISNTASSIESITIYPNPAMDVLHICADREVNAMITSIEGKIISKQDNIQSVSVQDLADGVYFIHLMDKNNSLLKVMKFSKLR